MLLQRTVLFLWVHCLAISGAMLLLPDALAGLGQDAQLTAMVRRYLMALLPSVWLEAVSRCGVCAVEQHNNKLQP